MTARKPAVLVKKETIDNMAKIFDSAMPGVAYFAGMIRDGFRQKLSAELRGSEKDRRMEHLGFGLSGDYHMLVMDNPAIELGRYPLTARLVEAYRDIVYEPVNQGMGLGLGPINRVDIIKYDASKGWMEYHQDGMQFKGFAGIFTVDGEAIFKAAPAQRHAVTGNTKPDKTAEVSFTVTGGGLILFRGYRPQLQHDDRPFHAIEEVKKDRYAVFIGRSGNYVDRTSR